MSDLVTRAYETEIDWLARAALAELGAEFAGAAHRQVSWDPGTPLPFEARLQLDDYAAHDEVVLVLEGGLERKRSSASTRPGRARLAPP